MSLIKAVLLIVSTTYFVGSVIAFFIFLSYSYYAGAVWCLFAGVTTVLITHLHLLLHRSRLSNWYGLEELDYLNRLAFAFIAVTLTGVVYHSVYCILTYHYKHTYDPSVIYAIICSVGASIWSLILKLVIDNIYGQLISIN